MHFLLAIDGSEPAARAAQWLGSLAQTALPLQCTVLFVQRPLLAGEVSALVPAHISLDAREEEATAALTKISALLAAAGVAHSKQTCMGDAAPTVLRRARECGADAIVMGRRGLGAIKAALLGSVSSEVIQDTNLPVIIVGENTPVPASQPVGTQRPLCMLLALDRFPNALRAADFAAQLSQRSGAQLHAVHVQPTLTLAEALLSPRQHLLDHWAGNDTEASVAKPRDLLRAKGIAIAEHAASHDAPDEAIGKLAAELACDLVVMGTRGLHPVSAAIMGSVTQGVLAQARTAVALVK